MKSEEITQPKQEELKMAVTTEVVCSNWKRHQTASTLEF